MKKRVFTDTEYWELKDEVNSLYQQADSEEDPKQKKTVLKTADELKKVLRNYESSKLKDVKVLLKKEKKLEQLRTKSKADQKLFFNISAAESSLINYTELSEKERNRLSVKKASLIEMMGKGMYVKLCNDANLYVIRKNENVMNGLPYISTARYGDILIQDVALLIERYYYESELVRTGHKA